MTQAGGYATRTPEDSKMQYTGSDLENLVPLWNRELPHRVNEPKREGFVRRDVNILGASIGQDMLGNVGPLAQDAFGARVVRQGAIKVTLK